MHAVPDVGIGVVGGGEEWVVVGGGGGGADWVVVGGGAEDCVAVTGGADCGGGLEVVAVCVLATVCFAAT